jgi:hypothetical protein
MLKNTICLIGLSAASAVNAIQYGYNHGTVRKDSELVAANFKDVDIDLYAPAFLDPATRQSGFKNGTQGPTSHEDMGMYHVPGRYENNQILIANRGIYGEHCRKERLHELSHSKLHL